MICHKRSHGDLYDEISGVPNRAAKRSRLLNQVPVECLIDSMGGKAISIPVLCDECEKRMADVVENHEDDRLVQAVVAPGCDSLWRKDKVEDCDGVLEEDSCFGEQLDSDSECGSLH